MAIGCGIKLTVSTVCIDCICVIFDEREIYICMHRVDGFVVCIWSDCTENHSVQAGSRLVIIMDVSFSFASFTANYKCG